VLLSAAFSCSGADSGAGRGVVFTVGSLGTSQGRFRQPRAIAVDPGGRFYVLDRTGRVQFFGPGGEFVTSWVLPEYEYGQPVGMAIESQGSVLVNDSHYQRILRFSADGSFIASWGSPGTGPGQFTLGRDVVVDSSGNVYTGDYGDENDRIMKFSPTGEFIKEWGRRGTDPGRFDRPQGMEIERREGDEYLLVADCNNHRIQRFDLEGRLDATWGELGTEVGQLRYPMSVAVGSNGEIYVCEWGNNRIQKYDADGNSLGTWGRAGRREGELMTPWDLEIGPDDTIYVVDYGNHRIQAFRWPS